jgi:import inner membrane translocase subunit TIM9
MAGVPMNMMGDLSFEEKKDFALFAAEMQMREMQQSVNAMGEQCFNACAFNFRSRSLDSSEQKCVANCAERYLQMVSRVGVRFAEQNEALMKQQAGMQ